MRLARWIADRAAHTVDKKQRRAHDALVAWARRVEAGEELSDDEVKTLRARFPVVPHARGASGREVDPESPLALGEGAALEALLCAELDVTGKGARPAAMAAARRLGEDFLDELAAEILRLEVVTLVERQGIDTGGAEISGTLWRGSTGAKLSHWIARLGDGRYALVGKTKGRWTWTAGERDDVLATVPDALMESAVAAVLGGKVATPAAPAAEVRGEIARIDDEALLAGGALDGEGRAWIALSDGRVGCGSRARRRCGSRTRRPGASPGSSPGRAGSRSPGARR